MMPKGFQYEQGDLVMIVGKYGPLTGKSGTVKTSAAVSLSSFLVTVQVEEGIEVDVAIRDPENDIAPVTFDPSAIDAHVADAHFELRESLQPDDQVNVRIFRDRTEVHLPERLFLKTFSKDFVYWKNPEQFTSHPYQYAAFAVTANPKTVFVADVPVARENEAKQWLAEHTLQLARETEAPAF